MIVCVGVGIGVTSAGIGKEETRVAMKMARMPFRGDFPTSDAISRPSLGLVSRTVISSKLVCGCTP